MKKKHVCKNNTDLTKIARRNNVCACIYLYNYTSKNITLKQMTILTEGKLSNDKYNCKPDRKYKNVLTVISLHL